MQQDRPVENKLYVFTCTGIEAWGGTCRSGVYVCMHTYIRICCSLHSCACDGNDDIDDDDDDDDGDDDGDDDDDDVLQRFDSTLECCC